MSEHPYSFPIRWQGDAIDAYAPFADRKGAFCLPIDKRYTLIGWEPLTTFSATGGFVTVDHHTRIDSPTQALQEFVAPFQQLPRDPYFPFYSGLVGYMSPAWGTDTAKDPNRGDLPDAWFGVYDTVIVYDDIEKRLTVVSIGLDTDMHPHSVLAEERATDLAKSLVRYNGKPASEGQRNAAMAASPLQHLSLDEVRANCS